MDSPAGFRVGYHASWHCQPLQGCVPCCVPVVYQLWYPTGRTPATVTFAFDNVRLKAAAHGIQLAAGQSGNTSIVIDYASGWIYLIQPSLRVCQQIQLPFGFEATCVPADALPLGVTLLGLGASGVAVDNFQIDELMAGLAMQFRISVRPQDCVPYEIQFWWNGQCSRKQHILQCHCGCWEPSGF